ncbi:hypothetical protein BH11PSE1_BH11PSE1_28280 [soil metagenome]
MTAYDPERAFLLDEPREVRQRGCHSDLVVVRAYAHGNVLSRNSHMRPAHRRHERPSHDHRSGEGGIFRAEREALPDLLVRNQVQELAIHNVRI